MYDTNKKIGVMWNAYGRVLDVILQQKGTIAIFSVNVM
jgi:hypothetical protein